MASERFDVLIVGAGLSGIGAACHLRRQCPDKSFAILERRKAMGGTWDLFRYPGIRSDSDMYTLGYNFKPWTQREAIAEGPAIRAYIEEAAREHGIERHIRYGLEVLSAEWSTPEATWTVEARREDGERVVLRCSFLMMCSGYYSYDRGHDPVFAGRERFQGRIVHPQFWPQDLDYQNKRVVVIGSGATAVTLVPALTDKAQHVTMLQRSPSYVISMPRDDKLAERLRRVLPASLVYRLVRARNVALSATLFRLSRARPKAMRRLLTSQVRAQLGKDFDMRHFTPRYEPWDQRLCAVPSGDLFKVLRQGRASVVTDEIERFTPHGILLKSGVELPAEIIVTATGLELSLFGGAELRVDGQPVDLPSALNYKGMMFSGIPNLSNAMGYTNASWTLKADLIAEYVCRLLKHMDATGMRQCTPVRDASVKEAPFVDLSSGYLTRAASRMPKQGDRAPWRLHQNYALDMTALRRGRVDDGVMRFTNPRPTRTTLETAPSAVASGSPGPG